MKRILLLVICLTLATGTLTPHFSVNAAVEQQDQRHNGRLKTETRFGQAVSLRAKQLIAKKKGFAKAYKDMIKRGLKPVFEQHGFTVLGVDLFRTASVKKVAFSPIQDIVDGDYEMSFFPFDNGNSATWEGIVYVRGQYDEATYTTMLDATQSDLSYSEVYYEYYYPEPGEGGSECVEGPCPIQEAPMASVNAPWTSSGPVFKPVSFTTKPAATMFGRLFRSWLGCSAAGCTAAATGCIYGGPTYLKCLGAWCGGTLIGCAIGVLIAG